jgi:hypothetical protein
MFAFLSKRSTLEIMREEVENEAVEPNRSFVLSFTGKPFSRKPHECKPFGLYMKVKLDYSNNAFEQHSHAVSFYLRSSSTCGLIV